MLGEYTQKFAEDFALFCGAGYCLPVANGTDALEIAIRAIIGEKRSEDAINEVITVANAGGYTSTACRLAGAVPVYVDINEDNQLIDITSLVNCLRSTVKAIVVTHLYGAAVNIAEIRKVLNDNNYAHIPIIEDCAQAHGAKVNTHRVGSLGNIATFSFYPTKNLGALGDAGAITTSDPVLFDRIKKLHQYGWSTKYQISVPYARNSRMDEIQAAMLSILLPHLDTINQARKSTWERYCDFNYSKIKFLNYDQNDYVAHLAVIRVTERDDFIAFMKSRNIAVDIHYPVLDCDQAAWQSLPMRIDNITQLGTSRKSVGEIVSIPCFPFMTDRETDTVKQALIDWENI